MHFLLLLAVAALLTLAGGVKLRVTGQVLCPDKKAPASAEIQLYDLDEPHSADDFGGSTQPDDDGRFILDGEVSDWLSAPEPYLRIFGYCYGLPVTEQVYILDCEGDVYDTQIDRQLYGPVNIRLDGRNTPQSDSC